MRIALTTTGNNLDAPLGDRFGRASKYLVYETETGVFYARSNEQSRNAAKGAGIRLAVQLAAEYMDSVITRHIGPIAYETLSAAQVVVYTCKAATVREAIHKLICGELTKANGANVKAHWVGP